MSVSDEEIEMLEADLEAEAAMEEAMEAMEEAEEAEAPVEPVEKVHPTKMKMDWILKMGNRDDRETQLVKYGMLQKQTGTSLKKANDDKGRRLDLLEVFATACFALLHAHVGLKVAQEAVFEMWRARVGAVGQRLTREAGHFFVEMARGGVRRMQNLNYHFEDRHPAYAAQAAGGKKGRRLRPYPAETLQWAFQQSCAPMSPPQRRAVYDLSHDYLESMSDVMGGPECVPENGEWEPCVMAMVELGLKAARGNVFQNFNDKSQVALPKEIQGYFGMPETMHLTPEAPPAEEVREQLRKWFGPT